MVFIAIIVVGAAAYFWLRRRRELFVLSVRDGRVVVLRGSAPGTLLSDFAAALKGVRRGTLYVRKEEGGARLSTSGIDAWVEQRLRNILRIYPLSSLRASRDPERNVLVRMFSFAWLAGLFER